MHGGAAVTGGAPRALDWSGRERARDEGRPAAGDGPQGGPRKQDGLGRWRLNGVRKAWTFPRGPATCNPTRQTSMFSFPRGPEAPRRAQANRAFGGSHTALPRPPTPAGRTARGFQHLLSETGTDRSLAPPQTQAEPRPVWSWASSALGPRGNRKGRAEVVGGVPWGGGPRPAGRALLLSTLYLWYLHGGCAFNSRRASSSSGRAARSPQPPRKRPPRG